jgi:chromosome segregation ATPase
MGTKEISKTKALNEARLRKIISQLEIYNEKFNHIKTIEDSIHFKNYDLHQYKNRMCGDLEEFNKENKEIEERLIINKERQETLKANLEDKTNNINELEIQIGNLNDKEKLKKQLEDLKKKENS